MSKFLDSDGETYRCLADTVYSPQDYPQAWQLTD